MTSCWPAGEKRLPVAGRFEVAVQQQVEETELDLAHRLHAALEVLRRDHTIEERARQGCAVVHMGCHIGEHFPFPAEIFHELAGQLDRIPLDTIDARDGQLIDLAEQMMQAVTALMEECDDVIMGKGRRLAVYT